METPFFVMRHPPVDLRNTRRGASDLQATKDYCESMGVQFEFDPEQLVCMQDETGCSVYTGDASNDSTTDDA